MIITINEVHKDAFVKILEKKEEYKRSNDETLRKTFIKYNGDEHCGSMEIEFYADRCKGKRKKDINEVMAIVTENLW